MRDAWRRAGSLGWKDLIAPSLTRVLDGDRPVGVHVAARAGGDTARFTDQRASLLQRARPGRRLNRS